MPRGKPEEQSSTGQLVGRVKIVKTLLDHLSQAKSVMLMGPPGIGKTAILREVAGRARQAPDIRRPIYCGQASTLKTTLRSIAEELLVQERPATRQRLGTLSIPKLRRLVMPRLRSGKYSVLLDHIGQVRGAYAAFLEGLAEHRNIPIIAAVRSLDHSETGWMWWVGWNFPRIEVPPLGSDEARQLIALSLDRAKVSLPDREEFIRDLIRLAEGNPRMIIRTCEMARASTYQVGGRTKLPLLLLDLKLHDLQDRIEAESRIPLRGPMPFSSG